MCRDVWFDQERHLRDLLVGCEAPAGVVDGVPSDVCYCDAGSGRDHLDDLVARLAAGTVGLQSPVDRDQVVEPG